MKLLVPHTGELQGVDARLLTLANFLGIRSQSLPLDKPVGSHAAFLEQAIPDANRCFLFNPRVMGDWVGSPVVPAELASYLLARFPYVLVHGVTPDAWVGEMVAALTGGQLTSVHAVDDPGRPYEVASDARDVCGPFAGLSFGPSNPANDRVFGLGANGKSVRNLISLDGRPLMAAVTGSTSQVLLLGSQDTAGVTEEVGRAPLSEYFSRLLPQAMALRHIFGEECWHPRQAHAAVTIDDPLLRRNYGYLNFDALLGLMEEHHAHASIAFIPHNYRRNSRRTIGLFRKHAHRLSLAFHGNDHTDAEFACTDLPRLHAMVSMAKRRMKAHEQTTGLHCDRLMVFPQGHFSVEAMEVLGAHNFLAAVNGWPHPWGQDVRLKIAELAQPAVLRYGGFPLFLRKYVKYLQSQDVAFNVFFGRPVLIVEHHGAFKNPASLIDTVRRVNAIAPGIAWTNLETATAGSILRRRAEDGTVQVRAFSRQAVIVNDSGSMERFCLTWSRAGEQPPCAQVLCEGNPYQDWDATETGIYVRAQLPAGASRTFEVVFQEDTETPVSLGFRWNASAFIRRRLCELRDNYVSRNELASTLAKGVQRMLLTRKRGGL